MSNQPKDDLARALDNAREALALTKFTHRLPSGRELILKEPLTAEEQLECSTPEGIAVLEALADQMQSDPSVVKLPLSQKAQLERIAANVHIHNSGTIKRINKNLGFFRS